MICTTAAPAVYARLDVELAQLKVHEGRRGHHVEKGAIAPALAWTTPYRHDQVRVLPRAPAGPGDRAVRFARLRLGAAHEDPGRPRSSLKRAAGASVVRPHALVAPARDQRQDDLHGRHLEVPDPGRRSPEPPSHLWASDKTGTPARPILPRRACRPVRTSKSSWSRCYRAASVCRCRRLSLPWGRTPARRRPARRLARGRRRSGSPHQQPVRARSKFVRAEMC